MRMSEKGLIQAMHIVNLLRHKESRQISKFLLMKFQVQIKSQI